MNLCITDYRTTDEEIYNLQSLGYKIILCPKSQRLYEAVNGHPDMQIFLLNSNTIIAQSEIDKDFIEQLTNNKIKVLSTDNVLSEKYPYDIILNCFELGDLFVHKIKYTDPQILGFMKDKKLVNVKQGYSKCSTVILNEKAIITSDIGICKALREEEIDVLFLSPGDIILEGFDYGFIGGSCGMLDRNSIAFYGNLNKYKYGKEVLSFLKKYKIEPYYLSSGTLYDRGTLFCMNEI